MKNPKLILGFLLFCSTSLFAQHPHAGQGTRKPHIDSLLVKHILQRGSPKFHKILQHPDKYRVQIIYTEINRDKNNKPSFHEYTYGLDRKTYFYPASLVKLPCSALSLEKINELNRPGLDLNSIMLTDSANACQKKITHDTSAANGFPSLAQYIRRMLLVSDNQAYSRTYEFLGPDYIHRKLAEKGFPDAFIVHRFDPDCNSTDNLCTNPIDFCDGNGKIVYHQQADTCIKPPDNPLGSPQVGEAYINGKGEKVNGPKDFSKANYLSLPDITHILRTIIFPESVPDEERFHMKESDRIFMLRYMSMLPRESDHPRYSKDYYDSYKKYLIYGDDKKKIGKDTVRIFNIVGQSYGFVADVAYICDFRNGVEFMLSAVIYTNEDGVINDNKYEYNTLALPWMAELGKNIYAHDRKRKRAVKPDLSEFKFTY